MKFFLELFNNNTFSFAAQFKSPSFTRSRELATAIRGLWWMKVTMVNLGLKGLIHPCTANHDYSRFLSIL